MSRGWRRECPLAVRCKQQTALTAELYLIRQPGPTAFIIQEDKKEPFKVCLGEEHTCTCRDHQTTRELCVHILWVFLKKLRLRVTDPLSFQLGLAARDLMDVLYPKQDSRPKPARRAAGLGRRKPVPSRHPRTGDTCPICLEEFAARFSPLVYCKYSCGNAVHGICMEIVAKHQESGDEGPGWRLKCPLCRGEFCTSAELKDALQDRRRAETPGPLALHPNLSCRICLGGPPLLGNVYRCLQCPQVVTCSACLKASNFRTLHEGHHVAVKQKPEDHWRPLKNNAYELPNNKGLMKPTLPKIKTSVRKGNPNGPKLQPSDVTQNLIINRVT